MSAICFEHKFCTEKISWSAGRLCIVKILAKKSLMIFFCFSVWILKIRISGEFPLFHFPIFGGGSHLDFFWCCLNGRHICIIFIIVSTRTGMLEGSWKRWVSG